MFKSHVELHVCVNEVSGVCKGGKCTKTCNRDAFITDLIIFLYSEYN